MALDYAKAYQKFIDEELCASSCTNWMTVNAEDVKFDGGKDIQLCELSTTGLGSYFALKTDGTAYPQGVVTNKWRSYSLFMDRGVQFGLDLTAPSDTGFMATAENVMRQFARTHLVREQDTYRICKIYNTVVNGAYSAANSFKGAITKENAVSELLKTLNAAQKSSEMVENFVALVNQDLKLIFMEVAAESAMPITFGNTVEINGVKYENTMYMGDLPCIFVPASRMVTEVTINDGRAEDQKNGGVEKSEAGKYINFIVSYAKAPLAVQKIESIKQFGPKEQTVIDGTLIQLRYLYDLFVPKAKVCSVAVHAAE